MSYGTRKAIAGDMKGERIAYEQSEEAIQRFDLCATSADISNVLLWAKNSGGWFLRTSEQETRMKEAYQRAKQRMQVQP